MLLRFDLDHCLILHREISNHPEAYVRRSVLFTASCILVALHPSFVASAVAEGNIEISEGLDWIRRWALKVAESDTDRDCHTVSKKISAYATAEILYYDSSDIFNSALLMLSHHASHVLLQFDLINVEA